MFAHTDTNNTIFTTLPEPAEMWQCIQLLICGSSAFSGLLTAKTLPELSNTRTLCLITYSHKYVWNGVNIPSWWAKPAYQRLRWLYLLEIWGNCHCESYWSPSQQEMQKCVTLHCSMDAKNDNLHFHHLLSRRGIKQNKTRKWCGQFWIQSCSLPFSLVMSPSLALKFLWTI